MGLTQEKKCQSLRKQDPQEPRNSVRSYCSLQTAGERAHCEQGEPCCGYRDHSNATGGREALGKTASITLEQQAPPKLLLLSISTPLPSTLRQTQSSAQCRTQCLLHCTGTDFFLQFYQPCKLQQTPHWGQQTTRTPSNPTRRKTGLSLS